MTPPRFFRVPLFVVCVLGCAWPARSSAQVPPQFSGVQPVANREITLSLSGQSGAYYQIEGATNLQVWNALATLASGVSPSLQYTDSAAPFLQARYYRAQLLTGSDVF